MGGGSTPEMPKIKERPIRKEIDIDESRLAKDAALIAQRRRSRRSMRRDRPTIGDDSGTNVQGTQIA